MTRVYSEALDSYLEVDRIIDSIKGNQPGPTLILTAGIHGNEPAGVFALNKVFRALKNNNTPIIGNVYGISGNLWALEKGVRYHKKDLNRVWNKVIIESIENNTIEVQSEDTHQQIELFKTIKKILTTESGPFYFIDLHTTSSETIPFLTVNDSLLNRNFTEQYPVPMILGIEEYLQGPLLSYINELGYIAFGYEGGQHNDLSSIENHISFIYLSLVFAGIVKEAEIDFYRHYEVLAKHALQTKNIYEIISRFELNQDDEFIMKPGFVNFQRITKGQTLATWNGKTITAQKNGRILMPQYQNQGDDGFFTILKVSRFFLQLSAFLRKLKLDRFLSLLPGIKWASSSREALLVNRNIARFYTKQLFHLFGYRSRLVDKHTYIMKNRETPSRTKEYEL